VRSLCFGFITARLAVTQCINVPTGTGRLRALARHNIPSLMVIISLPMTLMQQ
jgi:hypothetical protein